MGTITVTVPCRGEVVNVGPKGQIRGSSLDKIEPVQLDTILLPVIGNPSSEWRRRVLDYDLENSTCDIEVECEDTVWLGQVQSALDSMSDIADVEADFMEVIERATGEPGEQGRIVAARARAKRPLSISRADLALWKTTRGGRGYADGD